MKSLIFVYGTLKKRFQNHCFLAQQNYIGWGVTQKKYELHNLISYPALIDSSHPNYDGTSEKSPIYGEIYEVDDHCLQLLDDLEGVEEILYNRQIIALDMWQIVNLPTTFDNLGLLFGPKTPAIWSYFYLPFLMRNPINFWSL